MDLGSQTDADDDFSVEAPAAAFLPAGHAAADAFRREVVATEDGLPSAKVPQDASSAALKRRRASQTVRGRANSLLRFLADPYHGDIFERTIGCDVSQWVRAFGGGGLTFIYHV